jgi:hypothetical protein
VKVTNTGTTTTSSWTVTLTFANGQRITQLWNARTGSTASPYAITNESYNNAIGAGGSATFGFLGSWNGTNANPTLVCARTRNEWSVAFAGPCRYPRARKGVR